MEHLGEPCVIDGSGPAYDAVRAAFTEAWDGTPPVDIGVGGSIPFIATFREMFPGAAILVTGVEDPDGRAHGPNESLHQIAFGRVERGHPTPSLDIVEDHVLQQHRLTGTGRAADVDVVAAVQQGDPNPDAGAGVGVADDFAAQAVPLIGGYQVQRSE